MTEGKLSKKIVSGSDVLVADGIVRVLAPNPKDYTSAGTNTYVAGQDSVWVIDPGPADKTHIDAVLAIIGDRPVDGILITHTHMDHSPAADTLKCLTGAKTYGFGRLPDNILAFTDDTIDISFTPDIFLKTDDLIGKETWQVKAIHTPGHFPNHMCFLLPQTGVVFSGDHVMGWSTTVVVPPLGNMADYMNSLTVLEKYDARLMLPSHGEKVESPNRRINEVRQHRLMRHEQIAACLAAGITMPSDIVGKLYSGLTPCLVKAAMGCVRAHIEMIEQEPRLKAIA